jgi:two-component system, OmpR family, response regulator
MSTCLANRHFLVVDDEEFVRKLVARFLKQSGAAGVVEATDGGAAIAAIDDYDMVFDVVISDINMRPMNGLELLSAIRTGARGLKRNTPVLMLTAFAEADFVAEALALDADAFVVKPVGRETLIDRVVRVLERTVTIGLAVSYAAVGVGGGAGTTSTPPALPSRRAVDIPGGPVAAADLIPLEDVKANSILAQDIRFGDAQKLLLAAPVILTQGLLARLKDLRHLHNSYSHLWVVEPRMIDEEDVSSGAGAAGTSALTALRPGTRNVNERMVGDLFLAPTLTGPERAANALVEQIRSQTDEVSERAQARVEVEQIESGLA